ncbi:MAG: tetratricopeptide repeat protein [Hyphomicrobium sp.]
MVGRDASSDDISKSLSGLGIGVVGLLITIAACSEMASAQPPTYGNKIATPAQTKPVDTLKECEQDDVASFSIRACTILLSSDALPQQDRARIHKLRGRSWLTEDDPGQAALDYSQALRFNPNDEEALRGRVRAYDRQERFDLAVGDWTALIQAHPKDDALYRSRGASYIGAKKYAEAMDDYNTSLRLNAKELSAYIGRARIHDALGERDKAMDEFQTAVSIDPNYLPAFWERARMADRWGEKEIAIENYITVLKINGQYAHARKYLERLGVWSPY